MEKKIPAVLDLTLPVVEETVIPSPPTLQQKIDLEEECLEQMEYEELI